jgi:hypothetical protein
MTSEGTPDVASESTLVHSGQSSTHWPDPPLEVPDFGAEFADLPPLEDDEAHSGGAPGAGDEGGRFGQDLVSGPDFGAFTPEDGSSEGKRDAPARENGVVSEKGVDKPSRKSAASGASPDQTSPPSASAPQATYR